MSRITIFFTTSLLVAVLLAGLSASPIQAETLVGDVSQSSSAATPTAKITQILSNTVPTIKSAAPSLDKSTTVTVTDQVQTISPSKATLPLTVTQNITGGTVITDASVITATAVISEADPSGALADPANDAAYTGAIGGTVIANRTPAFVRFFVEGATYELDPQRSTGLDLPRPTAVLNLFNCDARSAEQLSCFWDPYLLTRDSFYEIVNGNESGALVSLTLREAGSPPAGLVWVQNRTGRREQVYFADRMVEIAPSSVQEFSVPAGGVGVFYLRTCISVAGESVCEWSAHAAESGKYYVLAEQKWQGNVPNSTVTALELQPILGDGVEAVETPPQTVCRLLVPALNVRSGPGLSFDITKKVRSTQTEVGSVIVVGRTDDSQWLAVDPRVIKDGWITGSANFIRCDGDIAALPVLVTAIPTPTPPPVVVAPPTLTPAVAAPVVADVVEAPVTVAEPITEEPTATPAATAPPQTGIPPGYAQIVVTNGFDQVMRFTLDQRLRLEVGPSEYDLQPGESLSFIVYPGLIAFSASTPWRGLSGQADFILEKDQSRSLWLVFIPDPNEPGEWELVY
jgi:hypothetical protein